MGYFHLGHVPGPVTQVAETGVGPTGKKGEFLKLLWNTLHFQYGCCPWTGVLRHSFDMDVNVDIACFVRIIKQNAMQSFFMQAVRVGAEQC